MKARWIAGLLAGWITLAQTPPPTPAQVETAIEAVMRGDFDRSTAQAAARPPSQTPVEIQPPRPVERPTGQTISVARLRHSIPREARKAFERAVKLSRKGDHTAAAAELKTAISRDSEYAAAHGQLGVEYGQLGRLREAEAQLRRALERDPDSWSSHYNLGLVLFRAGDLPEAERSLRRALDLSPDNLWAHLFLGYLLYQSEKTRADGLRHVEAAARSLKLAWQFLRNVQPRSSTR